MTHWERGPFLLTLMQSSNSSTLAPTSESFELMDSRCLDVYKRQVGIYSPFEIDGYFHSVAAGFVADVVDFGYLF